MSSADDHVTPDCGVIEINLRDAGQLFDNLDPSPFHARDLHRSVEEYIVESVKELPSQTLCALVVHFDDPADDTDEAGVVGDAIRAHFARRSKLLGRDLRQLIHRGCISLGIGLAFLVALFIIAQGIRRMIGETGFTTVLSESLLIVGWVAMWRPLEIFLYDWWPIVGERRVHDRLSRIEVRMVHLAHDSGRPRPGSSATRRGKLP